MVWVLRYFKFEQSEFLKSPEFDVNNIKNNKCRYYNNKNNTFNLKDVEPRNNKTKSKEYIFNDKQHLFSFEFVLIPGDIVDLNRSLYKTELFNNKTQYSKADILGSKYVFIWQSNK